MLLKQLKSKLLGGDRQKLSSPQRQILGTHWIKLPDVKKFVVKSNDWDTLFSYFGLAKKLPPEISWTPYRNAKYNNYMKKQIKRLIRFKDQPQVFFYIVNFLLSKSRVFRVSAWNKTYPRWHKELGLGSILKANRDIDRLIREQSTDMDFKRVYIPKGENDYRPLGVPTLPWRVYMQMLNNFLFIYIQDNFLPSQHGFIPGRGTLTAWTEVMKIEKFDYIFEFDLMKFFDEVSLREISKKLIEWKVPREFVWWLEKMNMSQPKLPKKRLLDEGKISRVLTLSRSLKSVNDYIDIERNISHLWKDRLFIGDDEKGVPQGSNLGPLIALVAMVDFLKQKPSVTYADDGLFYSNEPFEVFNDEKKGIYIHPEKSRWVKWDSQWQHPLKFLGLIWDGESLKADTRKGSTLIADDKRTAFSVLTSWYKDRKVLKYDLSWEEIFKGQFGGTLISKLYNGTWTVEDVLKHTRFNVKPGTLGFQLKIKHLDLFNSSSLSSFALVRLLTNNSRRHISKSSPFYFKNQRCIRKDLTPSARRVWM